LAVPTTADCIIGTFTAAAAAAAVSQLLAGPLQLMAASAAAHGTYSISLSYVRKYYKLNPNKSALQLLKYSITIQPKNWGPSIYSFTKLYTVIIILKILLGKVLTFKP
jgi:hypothetical protein